MNAPDAIADRDGRGDPVRPCPDGSPRPLAGESSGALAGVLAIPLSVADAGLLIHALREEDRVLRLHHWAHDGSAYARDQAASVLRMAGAATALGNHVVPVLVYELASYERVLTTLQHYAPESQVTVDFDRLLDKMHVLSGMARACGWQVEHTAAGWQWTHVPSLPAGLDIGDGDGRCTTEPSRAPAELTAAPADVPALVAEARRLPANQAAAGRAHTRP